MVVFKTIQISFIAIVFAAAILAPKYQRADHVFDHRFLSAVGAWIVAYLVAGVWLNRFRCPRCGKFYYWRLEWKGAVERAKNWRNCHHCGLQQDTVPDDRA
jgi:hypothetical protein